MISQIEIYRKVYNLTFISHSNGVNNDAKISEPQNQRRRGRNGAAIPENPPNLLEAHGRIWREIPGKGEETPGIYGYAAYMRWSTL